MFAKIHHLLQKPLYRYIIVGGSVYILELAVILAAQKAGASNIVAVGVSYWVGLVISFILQKVVAFSDKRTHHKILIPQIVTFSLFVLFNFGFTILFTWLVSGILPAAIARTIALGVTTIWNFYLYKTRIFKTGSKTIDSDITY